MKALLTAEQKSQYRESGFVVVKELFDKETTKRMIEHYMRVRAEGPKPGDFGGTPDDPDDPNHKYPLLLNMHNWDDLTQEWARNEDLLEVVSQLIGDKPVLRQTMFYFKPPGGRGSGFHQDQQYITVDPLIGAWVALDESDRIVGQMNVMPGSHKHGLQPVELADSSISFTKTKSVIPHGLEEFGVDMKPGDGLFFDGKLIHGAYPNKTVERWRRSFICHFIGEGSKEFEPEQGKNASHLDESA